MSSSAKIWFSVIALELLGLSLAGYLWLRPVNVSPAAPVQEAAKASPHAAAAPDVRVNNAPGSIASGANFPGSNTPPSGTPGANVMNADEMGGFDTGSNAPGANSTGAPTPAPPPPAPPIATGALVCIDPGHPSETSDGTHGAHVSENHVNWMVALKLDQYLSQAGVRCVLTKASEGQRVTNKERAMTANRSQAALFIRLHCDAASGSGTATYYPDRQGKTQGVTGPSGAVIAASAAAARRFHPAMMASLRTSLPDRGIHGDSSTYVGGRQGALTGSIFSQVPALTIEMCVLTNPKDERFAGSDAGQETLAWSIAQGVLAYLQKGVAIPGQPNRQRVNLSPIRDSGEYQNSAARKSRPVKAVAPSPPATLTPSDSSLRAHPTPPYPSALHYPSASESPSSVGTATILEGPDPKITH